jgi:hypothetical protein
MVHSDNNNAGEEEESLCLLEPTTTATSPGATVASTTGTGIITTTTGATSTKDVSMSTYSGRRRKENKTHEEAVGTFISSVQLQEGQGVTVTVEDKETTNNNSLLGSGFSINDKGRKRRFSYRLLVDKKSGKCAMKGRRRKARKD